MAVILVISPKSDSKSYWTMVVIWPFPFFVWNCFGLNSGWSFQHLDSSWPSFFQWVQVGLSPSFFTMTIFFPLPFPLNLWSSVLENFFWKFQRTLIPPISIWVACTQTTSKLLGLNIKIVCRKYEFNPPMNLSKVSYV